ncbi:MAG TPA: deoxynucleoside kinase [Kofleriaceae bacterium]|nr:deoxynucleoside kinase [Kofleriaceae bacterium]
MKAEPRRRFVAIEGPPGAGVSALARALAAAVEARLVVDPAVMNPFRDDFAGDPRRWGFQSQIFCLLARWKQQSEIGQDDLFHPGGVVCDYTFGRDALYAAVTLPAEELALYRRVHALLDGRLPRPDLVVYLTADKEILRSRIRRQVASSDRVIKLNVIDELARAMDERFFAWEETPLLVINTSELEAVELPGQLEELIELIGKTRAGVHHYRPMQTP